MKILIWRVENLECDCEGRKMDSFMVESWLASLYPYTWCYDPYVLSCSTGIFTIVEACGKDFEKKINSSDLVIVPHKAPDIPWGAIRRHISEGKPAILIQPSLEKLTGIPPLADVERQGRLLSNREHWIFRCNPRKEYHYPQPLWFDRYLVRQNDHVTILSMIDDWPDCVITGKLGLFASDFVHAYELYRLTPREFSSSGFTDDSTLSFVTAIRAVLGLDASEKFVTCAKRDFELRRDFHSFGYARRMVEELSKELLRPVHFSSSDALLMEAAKMVSAEAGEDDIRHVLRKAFTSLEFAAREIAPFPKYIVDSLHGGILFEKYGFAEYDYPTLANEWISMYLDMVDRKDYRFCLEFSGVTHENAGKRHPLFYDRIKSYCREGKVEIVNGTYGQPYPEFFSLESNVRQFTYGQKTNKKIFGNKTLIYIAQEFGLTPQHPNILAGYGYKHVCHRAQNLGRTSVEHDEHIIWEGKDGSTIPALPAHEDRSEADPICFFIHLPRFIAATAKYKYNYGIYVNMLDLFWMPPFREEHIRAAFYTSILGTYHTFSGFLEAAEVKPDEIKAKKAYNLHDYEFSVFSVYQWRGSIANTLGRIQSTETLLESAEKFDAFACITLGLKNKPLDKAWRALTAYENHDTIVVPEVTVGGHIRLFTGEPGPIRPITVEEVGWLDLQRELPLVSANLDSTLSEIAKKVDTSSIFPGNALVVFNPCSFSRKAFISQAGKQIVIPALGYVTLSNGEDSAKGTVQGVSIKDETILTNGILEICFAGDTGAIDAVYDLSKGRNLITGISNELVYGTTSSMVCEKFEVKNGIGCKMVVVEGKILGGGKSIIAFFHSEVKLQVGESRVFFETTIHPVAVEDGDQWVNSIRVRFRPAFHPININRIYLNVVERVQSQKFISLYLVDLFSEENDSHIFLHNTGAQHYIRHDDAVENVLLHRFEKERNFKYCLEVRSGEVTPIKSALDYQMPVYVRPISSVPNTGRKLPSSFSLLETIPEEVIVTYIAVSGHSVYLRIAESNGQGGAVQLKTGFPVKEAFLTDYYLKRLKPLNVNNSGDIIKVDLSPFAILNLELVRNVDAFKGRSRAEMRVGDEKD